MKFGKQLQAERIPGWSSYYLDYKGLKKIISSLSKKGESVSNSSPVPEPHTPHSVLTGNRPHPPLQTFGSVDDDRGPVFQRHNAFFFFKLERELDKINTFYLQKETELKLRLETLLAKRQAAAMHLAPTDSPRGSVDHVEWRAVEEGFQILQRDLDKLQQFIEMNATGFRKILKKWDKHSKSTTKELYLSRQVEVQPVFDRKLIAEMSDAVATCLLDLTNVSIDGGDVAGVEQLRLEERTVTRSDTRFYTFRSLERLLQESAATNSESLIRDATARANELSQNPEFKTQVLRILWKAVLDAETPLADLIMSLPPFSFDFVDDINGRTYLHEAAISGQLRLALICLRKGIEIDRQDSYGRTALHYASIHGHSQVCDCLVEHGSSTTTIDLNAFSPLIYAISYGHIDAVRSLLAQQVDRKTRIGDAQPLFIACETGNKELVEVLLASGFTCEPNANGEYPIHHAARRGHSALCELLVNYKGFDIADKFNEWTPLFHAARYGHLSCVNTLLAAGANPGSTDEFNRTPAFYSAWHGHSDVLRTLLSISSSSPSDTPLTNIVLHQGSQATPSTSSDTMQAPEDELDLIPSLSLPPPIMPFRSYGHNYLQSSHLIQISLGRDECQHPGLLAPIRLPSRMVKRFQDPPTEFAAKVIFNCKSETVAGPINFTVPVTDEKSEVMFQLPDLQELYLEISLHPSVGSKTIGRSLFLPSAFDCINRKGSFTSPLLDNHLHIIGEIDFEVRIISPFNDIALDVGGATETYWKSSTTSLGPVAAQPVRPHLGLGRGLAQNSPRNVTLSIPTANNLVTSSSLSGEYLPLCVQVSRDLIPIITDVTKIPGQVFSLTIADVTYDQLADLHGNKMTDRIWRDASSHREYLFAPFLRLEEALKQLPIDINIYIQMVYSDESKSELKLNESVDSVLRVVYGSKVPDHPRDASRRRHRKFVFSSSDTDTCAALNWKQPNYPVIFSPLCQLLGHHNERRPTIQPDSRCKSIASALSFIKTNNILGITIPANTLLSVHSLAPAIKETGVLLLSEGTETQHENIRSGTLAPCIDGFKTNGSVHFFDASISSRLGVP